MKNFSENIEYSKDWIIQEIIKTSIKEQKNNTKEVVKIRKIDLLNLVLKFIKLNEREN